MILLIYKISGGIIMESPSELFYNNNYVRERVLSNLQDFIKSSNANAMVLMILWRTCLDVFSREIYWKLICLV